MQFYAVAAWQWVIAKANSPATCPTSGFAAFSGTKHGLFKCCKFYFFCRLLSQGIPIRLKPTVQQLFVFRLCETCKSTCCRVHVLPSLSHRLLYTHTPAKPVANLQRDDSPHSHPRTPTDPTNPPFPTQPLPAVPPQKKKKKMPPPPSLASDTALIPRNIASGGGIWQDVPLASLQLALEYALSWVPPARLAPSVARRHAALRLASLWDAAVDMIRAFPPPANHAHFRRVHAGEPPEAGVLSRPLCAALAKRVEAFCRKDDLEREMGNVRPVGSGARKDGDAGVCTICGDLFMTDDTVECGNGSGEAERHRFCRPCFAGYVGATAIGHQGCTDLAAVSCAHTACQARFPEPVVRAHVNAYAQLLVDEKQGALLRRQLLAAARDAGVLDCTRCGAFALVQEKTDAPVRCPGLYCRAVYCGQLCGAAPHGDRPCPPKAAPGWLAVMISGEENSAFCPNCTEPVTRASGCTRMTCRSCGTWFCVVCGGGYDYETRRLHANCVDPGVPGEHAGGGPAWDGRAFGRHRRQRDVLGEPAGEGEEREFRPYEADADGLPNARLAHPV